MDVTGAARHAADFARARARLAALLAHKISAREIYRPRLDLDPLEIQRAISMVKLITAHRRLRRSFQAVVEMWLGPEKFSG